LAFAKAARGQQVDWIGNQLTVSASCVTATIKKVIVDDLLKDLQVVRTKNVVSYTELQSIAGRISHVALLMVTWRPFLQMIFSAMAEANSTNSPLNTVWVKQFRIALDWFIAFLSGCHGGIIRNFDVHEFAGWSPDVSLVMDASPWALGAFLLEDGRILEYFSSEITAEDESRFKAKIGEAAGQQIWESLTALVACRVWAHRWQRKRVTLQIKGDSVAMLTLILKMRPPTPELGLISREIALDVAESCYRPKIMTHIPGVANTIADQLSREYGPKAGGELPRALCGAVRIFVPVRNNSYFRTLSGPASPP
jgi:hypothetical protein